VGEPPRHAGDREEHGDVDGDRRHEGERAEREVDVGPAGEAGGREGQELLDEGQAGGAVPETAHHLHERIHARVFAAVDLVAEPGHVHALAQVVADDRGDSLGGAATEQLEHL
jgi:hypothetical protein